MQKIEVVLSDERLITPSGLTFVGQILGKSDFVKKMNRAPISKEYFQSQIKNGDIQSVMPALLEAIDSYPEDEKQRKENEI